MIQHADLETRSMKSGLGEFLDCYALSPNPKPKT